MKVALAGDHAGFPLKQMIKDELVRDGRFEVLDLGTHDTQPSDYPDAAEAIGRALSDGKAERGIVVCGSGVGVTVAANKIPGVRAGLCHDHYSAHQGVEHDDMNVLCLGARIIGQAPALEIVKSFLSARFTREERHQRRLDKVNAIEKRFSK
jgi:ribose 5-phosphate isomerase B